MKKNILITGATKGIGLETSKRLASTGYQVIGIARGNIDSFPGILICCDLSQAEQTAQAIEKIQGHYPIDGLVNNVGLVRPQPLDSVSLSNLQEVYEVNVRAAVQLAQAFVGGMKERKWGRIINVTSRAILGMPDRTSYGAAKSALVGCTRTWALELALFGITVNAVAPGPIETELFRQIHKPGSKEEKAKLVSVPMGRIGKPREIAAAIEFLLSEDAGFMTGQVLHIDGGGSLPNYRSDV